MKEPRSIPATTQLRRPDGRRYGFAEICGLSARMHEALFVRGVAPPLAELVGWEFRGVNGGPFAPLLRLRRFIKGFRGGENGAPEQGMIDGYNLWAQQPRDPSAPWLPTDGWWPPRRDRRPRRPVRRHGFYKVLSASTSATDHRYPHALLLDYGLADNPWTHPARLLRDYMVQVYADHPGLLIGKAYVALGSMRIFGSHFVMERLRRAPPEG